MALAAAGWRAELFGVAGWLAVGGGDGVSDQGDVTGVEVARDGTQADGDFRIAEAGSDPQDGPLLPGHKAGTGGNREVPGRPADRFKAKHGVRQPI